MVGLFCTNALSCIYPDTLSKRFSVYLGPLKQFKFVVLREAIHPKQVTRCLQSHFSLERGVKPFIMPRIAKHLHTVLLLRQSASRPSPHKHLHSQCQRINIYIIFHDSNVLHTEEGSFAQFMLFSEFIQSIILLFVASNSCS